jgi:hypothetical protein
MMNSILSALWGAAGRSSVAVHCVFRGRVADDVSTEEEPRTHPLWALAFGIRQVSPAILSIDING